jgi:hypothetical protein
VGLFVQPIFRRLRAAFFALALFKQGNEIDLVVSILSQKEPRYAAFESGHLFADGNGARGDRWL